LSAAHEEFDPITGEYFNVAIFPGLNASYKMLKISRGGQTSLLANIPIPSGRKLSTIHSFSSTKRYLILIASALYVAWKGVKVLWTRNIEAASEYCPQDKVHFYVIDRAVN
jgi:carotenoid cleavage dioxygenase-like enzyme